MGIALGSCIQIALFVAPALVLLSYAVAPQPLELSFGRAELGSLFLAVLIGAMVSADGRSNWYKGVQLITVYVIMAFLFYFIPEGTPRCSDSAVVRTIGLSALARAYLRRRYAYLFYTLMSTMVAAPVLAAFDLPGVLIESLLAANLLAAVLPVSAGTGRSVLLALMILVWLARSAIA